MPLISTYVLPVNRSPTLFGKIRYGQAPERFTHQILKDWGFKSTNDRAFLPLLKALGFLTADGNPTQMYLTYRDHSRSKEVLGQALREAYGDIFFIKEHPTQADKSAIEGKFKSFHNTSENVAGLMASTFFGLLALADISKKTAPSTQPIEPTLSAYEHQAPIQPEKNNFVGTGLHYNIQIHLPATKDVEVYNAIFKSLREHLFHE